MRSSVATKIPYTSQSPCLGITGGYKEEDNGRLGLFRTECQKAFESAKVSYLANMGYKLKNPGTSQKPYWKIIHRVMNKCRSPKIPPLPVNDKFILDFGEKAKYINFSNR